MGMNIKNIKISDIKVAEYNPRIIRKEEFEGLKASLKEFGQQENFIINKDGTLISGHQRLEAAKQLGWAEVTVNVLDVDKITEKKLNLVMNSRSIQGVFDELKLAELLEELKFEDGYGELRLDTLEPLDLSDIEFDKTTMASEDEYRNRAIKTLQLAFGLSEYEDFMAKIESIISLGKYGSNPSEVIVNLVGKTYEHDIS